MLGPVSGSFWSSPGTWWLLVAMLGVGASEELVFRGLLLGSLSKRLPRAAAEATSAAIFAAVHLPQRLASGMAMADAAVSLSVLFVWGWCYAVAMRAGRNVPGLALVHAVTNVCV
jgi:membrane protease YdiL (CAAX protease family)